MLLYLLIAAAGAAGLALGAWTAVVGRRPAWLPARPMAAGTARAWGVATGLAGVGLLILGVDMIGPRNGVLQVVGFLLLVLGAAVVVIAPPGSRRAR